MGRGGKGGESKTERSRGREKIKVRGEGRVVTYVMEDGQREGAQNGRVEEEAVVRVIGRRFENGLLFCVKYQSKNRNKVLLKMDKIKIEKS